MLGTSANRRAAETPRIYSPRGSSSGSVCVCVCVCAHTHTRTARGVLNVSLGVGTGLESPKESKCTGALAYMYAINVYEVHMYTNILVSRSKSRLTSFFFSIVATNEKEAYINRIQRPHIAAGLEQIGPTTWILTF